MMTVIAVLISPLNRNIPNTETSLRGISVTLGEVKNSLYNLIFNRLFLEWWNTTSKENLELSHGLGGGDQEIDDK